MTELWDLVWKLGDAFWNLLSYVLGAALHWLLAIAWFAWWLGGVNWNKAWPVLRSGAWVGVVLAMLTSALVWAELAPGACDCLGFITVPNFWWQLGGVSTLVALALFAGWLQGQWGYAPPEVPVEPAAGHDHGSAHAHAHH